MPLASRSARRAVFFAATIFASAGCSLIAGFDGFVGAPLDGSTTEAATEAGREDGGTDATFASDGAITDTSTNDEEPAPPNDAGPDAAYCASLSPAAMFCDDFERTGNVQGPWNGLNLLGAATMTLVNAESNTFARSAITSDGTTTTHNAFFEYDSASMAQKITIAWKLRLPAITDPNLYIEAFDVELGGTAYGYREVYIESSQTGPHFAFDVAYKDGGSGPSNSVLISGALPAATFEPMLLVIDLKSQTAMLTVGTSQFPLTLSTDFAPTTFSLYAGINYSGENSGGPISGTTADLDDVTINYE